MEKDNKNDSGTGTSPLVVSTSDNINFENNNVNDDNASDATATTAAATIFTRISCHKIVNKIRSYLKVVIDIYSDQSGSCQSLMKGLSLVVLLGAFLGIVMPKDLDLPSHIYRYISSVIGYTYFISWSISFFPQIITNYKQKSTDGLSTDSSLLAVLNYTCYTIYNTFFFWDESIRKEYRDRHGEHAELTVEGNDVAFAIDALTLSIIILAQVFYYRGFKLQPPSKSCWIIVAVTTGICFIQSLCIFMQFPGFLWIDFLYTMATIKLILTVMTYIPQMLLNYNRKSTDGFNIWNVIFDFSGGLLSLMQLYFDCANMKNFEGITGNWPKLALSLITLLFDGIYFTQHFVLYCDNNNIDHISDQEEREFFYNLVEDVDENGEDILTEFV